MEGVRCVVQGLGHVGMSLVALLHHAGARVTVSDIDAQRVASALERFGVSSVAPEQTLDTKTDLLLPCAVGGVLTHANASRLRCRVVVGAANNQLQDDAVADALSDAGVLYVPDFVANAGGLIHVAAELLGFTKYEVEAQIHAIGDRVTHLLTRADDAGTAPLRTAMSSIMS